jgi:hypothetical protein
MVDACHSEPDQMSALPASGAPSVVADTALPCSFVTVIAPELASVASPLMLWSANAPEPPRRPRPPSK